MFKKKGLVNYLKSLTSSTFSILAKKVTATPIVNRKNKENIEKNGKKEPMSKQKINIANAF